MLLFLNIVVFGPSVSADEPITLVNWDDGVNGASSGTLENISFTRSSGEDFSLTTDRDYSSPLCLQTQNWFETSGTHDQVDEGTITLLNSYDYITNITLYTDTYFDNAAGRYHYIEYQFKNNSNVVIKIRFMLNNYTNNKLQFYDVASGFQDVYTTTSLDAYHDWLIEIEWEGSNIFNVYCRDRSSKALLGSLTDVGGAYADVYKTFTSITITGYRSISGSGTESGIANYLDDIIIIGSEYEAPPPERTFYLKIFESDTGQQLKPLGSFWGVPQLLVDAPAVKCNLTSDLWEGEYDPNGYNRTVTITVNVTEGTYHWINVSKNYAYVNGAFIWYNNISVKFQIYELQVYSIYLGEADPEFYYDNCKYNDHGKLYGTETYLCTDKNIYTKGEEILFKYQIPPAADLYGTILPTGPWYIWIYDKNNLGWPFYITDGGRSADNFDYISNWKCINNGLEPQEYYLSWTYGGDEGYKDPTGIDEYWCYIGHPGGGLFGFDLIIVDRLKFRVTSGTFTPQGNITSLSPSAPKLGQEVNISFNTNNNGKLRVKNLLDPDELADTITSFQKFDGIESVIYQFWEFGIYKVFLEVWDGYNFTEVDSEILEITDVNGTYGAFGYGVEFLTVEPQKVIAGYDTIYINYKVKKDNSSIIIIDPRGQRLPFSTLVNEGFGVLNISLPSYSSVGNYNITMYGNETLHTSFDVIADENNYVEFYRNDYMEGSPFSLKIKHNKKVEIVFYKNNIAVGQDWYLDVGSFEDGVYEVPASVIAPSSGNWRVELWEVNNLIKLKKLSEDTAFVVITGPDPATQEGYDNIFEILAKGAKSIGGETFGLSFFAIFIIMFVMYLLARENLKNNNVYLIGVALMLFFTYIGWLPIWIAIVAIVMSALVFGKASTKKMGIGG